MLITTIQQSYYSSNNKDDVVNNTKLLVFPISAFLPLPNSIEEITLLLLVSCTIYNLPNVELWISNIDKPSGYEPKLSLQEQEIINITS
jgi:hypothetical protein